MKIPAGKNTRTCRFRVPKHPYGWGDHLSPQIPETLWVPLKILPNKVAFTCTSVSGTLAGTCWSHLSQMGVTVSRHVTPAGIICRCICGSPMLCPRKWYPWCFHSGPNPFPTIPDGTAMNPPLCTSGFPLIWHWERKDSQAIHSNSQLI